MHITAQDKISTNIKRIQARLQLLPQEAYAEFVKDTPIRTGNARRSTRLNNKTIEANYAYAKRLDEGYSPQAPNGMVKPTEAFIKKRIGTILRGR